MIEIEKPKIETEILSEDGTHGKFVVEPLERGFGTTLGNSLWYNTGELLETYFTVFSAWYSSNLH